MPAPSKPAASTSWISRISSDIGEVPGIRSETATRPCIRSSRRARIGCGRGLCPVEGMPPSSTGSATMRDDRYDARNRPTMRGNSLPITILIVLVLIGTALVPSPAAAQEPSATTQESSTITHEPSTNPWFMTVVGGVYSGSQLLEIPMHLELKDSYTFGVSVSKQFAEFTRFMRLEGELQVLKHFGDQDHWEFTGSVNLRWVVFPWT